MRVGQISEIRNQSQQNIAPDVMVKLRLSPSSQIEGVVVSSVAIIVVVVDLDGEVLDAAEVEEEVAVDVEAPRGHEAKVEPTVAHVLQRYKIGLGVWGIPRYLNIQVLPQSTLSRRIMG